MPTFSSTYVPPVPPDMEEVFNPQDVIGLQLAAGGRIQIRQGSYSERKIVVPDPDGRRETSTELFECQDEYSSERIIGKTDSIIAMWVVNHNSKVKS